MANNNTVPRTCSACGYDNMPGEMFCQNCGVQIAPLASVPPPPPMPVFTSSPSTPSSPSITRPSAHTQAASRSESDHRPGVPPGILFVRDTQAEIAIPEGKSELLIGRSDPVRAIYPDIDLATYGGEAAGVSRQHARLVIDGAQLFLEDLNSTNFTFLNREKLQPAQRYLLHHQDELRLGMLALEYRAG